MAAGRGRTDMLAFIAGVIVGAIVTIAWATLSAAVHSDRDFFDRNGEG